ncbi:MAG: mcpA 6 [Firmicutes bacterium]|nr:mcpA 6 [Bacillota bacterium]
MKTIQAKLTVTILVIFLVALSTLGGLNYWKARAIVTDEITKSMGELAEHSANGIGDWVEKGQFEIAGIATAQVFQSGNMEEIVAALIRVKKDTARFEALGYIEPNGICHDDKGVVVNVASRAYFQQAMNGEKNVSDPLISPATGNLIVVLAVPVKADGKVTGVLFGSINITDITKEVLGVKAGETGYGYLVRGDGLIIIHPSKEVAMKTNALENNDAGSAMKVATERMVKGESGVVRYEYKGADKMLAFAPVPGTKWSLAATVPTAEVTGVVASLTLISMVTIAIVLVLAAVIIAWYARRIAKPIQGLELVANRIAGGDISETKLNINSDDEIGRLSQSFEQMAKNLRTLIHKVHGATDQVAASSEELTASSDQAAQAANHIATSIISVAAGADEQLAAANDTSAVVEQMSASIQQVAANANQVASQSAMAADKAKDGDNTVVKAVAQMGKIEETVNSSAQVVTKLGERSKEIGQIVDSISSIASQTNLLALNAAIEAARAGEQGRGFAVVAEEVRKLAEQSQDAAKKIAQLIGEIQGETDKAVVAMNDGTREVKIGAEVVKTAGDAFREIVGLVSEVSGQMSEISEAIHQMAAGSQQIVGSVRKIDQFGKKSAGESQAVSAAAEEQLASMEEIASSSQALAMLAQELQSSVSAFKL